jgi:hypothetical protein
MDRGQEPSRFYGSREATAMLHKAMCLSGQQTRVKGTMVIGLLFQLIKTQERASSLERAIGDLKATAFEREKPASILMHCLYQICPIHVLWPTWTVPAQATDENNLSHDYYWGQSPCFNLVAPLPQSRENSLSHFHCA